MFLSQIFGRIQRHLYAIVAVIQFLTFIFLAHWKFQVINFYLVTSCAYLRCYKYYYLPCCLAQILILKGDKLYDTVCKVSWYSMKESDKKSMALLMFATGKPQSLMCEPKQMNLQMFVEVFLRLPFTLID